MSDDPALARLDPEPPRWTADQAVEALDQCATPPAYDPEQHRRAYEDQVVGPNSETRAQMRQIMLRRLDDLDDVLARRTTDMEAVKLRLRVHQQRCALLGLGFDGSRW